MSENHIHAIQVGTEEVPIKLYHSLGQDIDGNNIYVHSDGDSFSVQSDNPKISPYFKISPGPSKGDYVRISDPKGNYIVMNGDEGGISINADAGYIGGGDVGIEWDDYVNSLSIYADTISISVPGNTATITVANDNVATSIISESFNSYCHNSNSSGWEECVNYSFTNKEGTTNTYVGRIAFDYDTDSHGDMELKSSRKWKKEGSTDFSSSYSHINITPERVMLQADGVDGSSYLYVEDNGIVISGNVSLKGELTKDSVTVLFDNDVVAYNPTLKWGIANQVASVGTHSIEVTMPSKPTTSVTNKAESLSYSGATTVATVAGTDITIGALPKASDSSFGGVKIYAEGNTLKIYT